jgi:hypothetical protein
MLQLNNAGNNFTETALLMWQLPIGAGVHCLRIMIKMASKIFVGNGIPNVPMIWTT